LEIGEEGRAVMMQSTPLTWECPVGLDVQILSRMADVGEEIAQYRARDDDQDEDVESSAVAGTAGK
jgi:hypothetical protein